MKKFISVILLIVLAFTLVSCVGKKEEEPEEEVPKVGLICLHDENSTYDLNFINGFKEACGMMGFDYIIKTNVPESEECYNAAAELADSGCVMVFADSFGHEDFMIQAAREFPDVEFCHATGTKAHTEKLPNFHNAFAAIYEGRYLDGVALGMKIEEMRQDNPNLVPKVGYIGAFTYAEVISGYTSFFLGVRSVCPDATMTVTFTGSWYDETAEKEAANTLIHDGCIAISGHADSMGAPTACEAAGVPFVFYNGSVAKECPNTFIVSTKIDWAPYVALVLANIANGKATDADYTGTLSTGSVVMTEVNEAVAAPGTADKLAEIIERFKSGDLAVFDVSTFTVDGEHLTEYMADVDTDPDYTPDTQVILSGKTFMESAYRSAPYFDIMIDGIEIANTAF